MLSGKHCGELYLQSPLVVCARGRGAGNWRCLRGSGALVAVDVVAKVLQNLVK